MRAWVTGAGGESCRHGQVRLSVDTDSFRFWGWSMYLVYLDYFRGWRQGGSVTPWYFICLVSIFALASLPLIGGRVRAEGVEVFCSSERPRVTANWGDQDKSSEIPIRESGRNYFVAVVKCGVPHRLPLPGALDVPASSLQQWGGDVVNHNRSTFCIQSLLAWQSRSFPPQVWDPYYTRTHTPQNPSSQVSFLKPAGPLLHLQDVRLLGNMPRSPKLQLSPWRSA